MSKLGKKLLAAAREGVAIAREVRVSKSELIAIVKRRLEAHPGDAPWSCIQCYHGRPCADKEILLAALKELEKRP